MCYDRKHLFLSIFHATENTSWLKSSSLFTPRIPRGFCEGLFSRKSNPARGWYYMGSLLFPVGPNFATNHPYVMTFDLQYYIGTLCPLLIENMKKTALFLSFCDEQHF